MNNKFSVPIQQVVALRLMYIIHLILSMLPVVLHSFIHQLRRWPLPPADELLHQQKYTEVSCPAMISAKLTIRTVEGNLAS
jgi:hypothetical protein